jgi:succinate-acetate transporter protein
MARAGGAREARKRTSTDKEREMAVNVDREPMVFAIEDDPMAMRRTAPAIADPAPLGLAALALTTLVFSVFNAGLINRAGAPVVLGLALAYGGVTQLLAGMWEFRRGNTFGAMAFGSFGAFWLSYWALEQFFVKQIPVSQALNAMALFFIVWAIFSALMWVAAVRTTAAVGVVLALLTVTFLLLGIGDAGPHATLIKIAGWFGIATAAAGLYAAFAALINSTYERTLLPLRPMRHGG